MADPNRLTLQRAVPAAEFRRMALLRALDLLRGLYRRWESRTRSFQARQAVTLLQFQTLDDLAAAVRAEAERLAAPAVRAERVFGDRGLPAGSPEVAFEEIEKDVAEPLAKLLDLSAPARTAAGLVLLHAYNQLLAFEARFGSGVDPEPHAGSRLTADETHVYFFVAEPAAGEPSSARERTLWSDRSEAARFITAVGRLLQGARSAGRRPNAVESAITQAAYGLLAEGTPVATPYRGLGVPGFKATQTVLFLTDPGDGHLQVTCHARGLLEGGRAALHIEHIDRDETKDKNTQIIEAYRLPAPLSAAKVRLHVGPDAVCTAFIGRPVFENRTPGEADPAALRTQYRLDRLKSAHMTASCCTAMFLNGVAECKIAIERMTASDAVDFMRAVAGNTFRDRHRQYLSAAFNIFTPIYDDFRQPDQPALVTDAQALCKLGIALAVAGGFQKVTWDGAKPNQFPSLAILARGEAPDLGHAFWLRVVHEAHLHGLVTYVSAGLEPQHMPRAVFAGLDGVGIGVKLHFYDKATGRTGDFDPAVMEAVLATAARAERTILGRAAKTLARLARLRHEGLLSDADEPLRVELLECLAGLKLPKGLGVDATEADKDALTRELLSLGDESPEARQAAALMERSARLTLGAIADDDPLESPLEGQVRRLELHLSHTKAESLDLRARLARLRGELRRSEDATAWES